MNREYRTDLADRLYVNARRARLRAIRKCINGPVEGFVSKRGTEHGPVVGDTGKCARCIAIHARTSSRKPLVDQTIQHAR